MINTATAHEEATCGVSLEREISGIIFIVFSIDSFVVLLISNDCITILCFDQNEDGIDYDDLFLVQAQISDSQWLTHPSCIYLLCCIVCKDCKNISTRPCEQPAGKSWVAARDTKMKAIGEERALAK